MQRIFPGSFCHPSSRTSPVPSSTLSPRTPLSPPPPSSPRTPRSPIATRVCAPRSPRPFIIPTLALALLLLFTSPLSAQPTDARANAEVRLTEIAQQLASSTDASPATSSLAQPAPAPAQNAVPIDPIEASPLFTSPSSPTAPIFSPSPSAPSSSPWLLSTFGALGLVLAVILFIRWAWLRLRSGVSVRSSPVVEVLSRTAVAPRNHVLLLRVGNQILVVGDSPAGLRTLTTIHDPHEIASLLTAVTATGENSISRGFSQMLSHFNSDYDDNQRTLHEGADHHEHRLDRARDSVSSLLSRLRAYSQRGGGQ